MIEIKRNDENFNLDNVSDKELFEGIKDGMVESIKNMPNFEYVTNEKIKLLDESSRRQIIGSDGNLYPHINLSTRIMPNKGLYFSTHANFLINPFDIRMVVVTENGIETIEAEELTSAFTKFMTSRFPDGNYLEKKAEYERKVEIRNRVYDDMVFGN